MRDELRDAIADAIDHADKIRRGEIPIRTAADIRRERDARRGPLPLITITDRGIELTDTGRAAIDARCDHCDGEGTEIVCGPG